MSDEISKRGSSSASVLKASKLKAPPRPSKYAQVSHKIVLLTIAIALNQCDQMARLFEFFCPFMTLKYFQITNKLPQKFQNFAQYKINPYTNAQDFLNVHKVAKFRLIWSLYTEHIIL